MADLVLDLVHRQLKLGGRPVGDPILGQHGADLGEGEAQLLALENHGQTIPVPGAVDPRRAVAAGREKPTILVKAQSPQGNTELTRQIADGVELAALSSDVAV